MNFQNTSPEALEQTVQNAWLAFHEYRKRSIRERAQLMRAIARELEGATDGLVQTAMSETHLPKARLEGELKRTIFQLDSYAAACEQGAWLEARIDTADLQRTPPKPDIRKMLVPVGPVVVFGASNFPFAYSTAGGDTACALAAGCPVIVKAHPAHAETSEAVAALIARAVAASNLPAGVFGHVHDSGTSIGEALVKHDKIRSVGFTGSYRGGKQLFDWAAARKEPIPVFAEMGSINPVFLLTEKLKQETADIAKMLAGSVTLSVGQFCTNPGLIIGVESPELNDFMGMLGNNIRSIAPGEMLHPGIAKSYVDNREKALQQTGVSVIATAETEPKLNEGTPTIASASGDAFLNNPVLHQEVFGPYSLIIRCSSAAQMLEVAQRLEGQLTATIVGTTDEIKHHHELVETIKDICGRLIINGVPTGVEVCLSMQHGGPFPATTDSRFTSVGADGIRRFARPVSFQSWPDELLPDELKQSNPLGIWRTINSTLTPPAL